MSQRIYYEIDGHVRGPISLTQLQLMATSGMIQPHHRLRREDSDQWFVAQTVRGLFSEPAATLPLPAAADAAMPMPAGTVAENSFGDFAAAAPPEFNPAFDFFSNSGPEPRGPSGPAAAKPDEPLDLPEAEPATEEPASSPTTVTVVKPAKQPDPPADAKAAASASEVVGRAVELLPDDSLRLLEGKTSFRLHRGWLVANSRFADGSNRTVYLRLQRIDAGILDQRSSQTRGKSEPLSLLSFFAGAVRVGLVFQGSEKPYRAFLERALSQSSTHAAPTKPPTKS
jgi:hypothetical protein